MKNNVLKWIKRTVSVVALTVIVVSGIPVMANASDRATENGENGIVYVNYSSDYSEYSNGNKAPEYSDSENSPYGYVFGGWYSKEGTSFNALNNTALGSNPTNVYAKFVPAYVLSVKCQNKSGTEAGMQGTTALKVISSLDSTNYKSFGFEMTVVSLNDDGTYSSETSIASEDSFTKAFDQFKVYKKENGTDKLVATYDPENVFGDASMYFTTWGVGSIGSGSFSKIICIKPCWITIDGTKVYGLTKYAHVEDGLLQEDGNGTYRYVNVPINLRETAAIGTGVAAGVLNVNYSNAGATLEFAEVEGGRYFEEMAWANKSDSVKMVGNKSTITNDLNTNDIYANVRFKLRTSDAYAMLSGYNFAVSGEDFSNSAETQFTDSTYNVWDVKY